MVSIYSQDNLGRPELISDVYQKDGSFGGPGLIHGVHHNVDRTGWAWPNQCSLSHSRLAWVGLA